MDTGVPILVGVHGLGAVSRIVRPAQERVRIHGLASPGEQAFGGVARVVQRLDGWLGDVDALRVNLQVIPRLEPVVVRGNGRAAARGLVGEQRSGHAESDLVEASVEGGSVHSVVGRVGAVHNEGRHPARLHVLHEGGEGGVIALMQGGLLVDVDGRAEGAERHVDGVDDALCGDVVVSGDHQAVGSGGLQVGCSRLHTGEDGLVESSHMALTVDLIEQGGGHVALLGGLDAGAAVGVGSREGHSALEGVQDAHGPILRTAGLGPFGRVPDGVAPRAEEVGVEGDHSLRVGEIVRREDPASEVLLGRFDNGAVADGITLDVLDTGGFRQSGDGAGVARAHHRAGQQDLATGSGQALLDRSVEGGPVGGLTVELGSLKAGGVVETKDGGVDAGVDPAVSRLGVALDEDRTAFARLHQDVHVIVAVIIGGGVVVRDTRGNLLGLVGVRNRLDHRRLAGSERGGSHGEAHELEEVPAPGVGALKPIVGEELVHWPLGGELLGFELLEFRGAVQLLESGPVNLVVSHGADLDLRSDDQ